MPFVRCDKKSRVFFLTLYNRDIFRGENISFFLCFLFPRKIFCLFGWFCVAQRKTKVNGKNYCWKFLYNLRVEIDLLQFRLFYFSLFSILLNLYAIISCSFVDFRASPIYIISASQFSPCCFFCCRKGKKNYFRR